MSLRSIISTAFVGLRPKVVGFGFARFLHATKKNTPPTQLEPLDEETIQAILHAHDGALVYDREKKMFRLADEAHLFDDATDDGPRA